jgi:amino acid adenylation domain-containing protein
MIMDEVITGFRVHPRGAQGVFGVKADLASYGKVIGGGHPLGVLAGTNRFMDALDGGQWRFGDDSFPEVGVTFFAGTFVRHPLAMAAAKACLVHLKEQGPALQEALSRRTTRLVDALNGLFQQYGVPSSVQRFGSVFYFAFAPEHRLLSLLHYVLRLRGIHIWEGFPCFLTTAHGDGEIDTFIRAVEGSLQELTDGGFLPATGTTPGPTGAKTAAEPAPTVAAPVASQSVSNDDTSSIVMPLAEQLPLTEVQRELWVASQLSPEASVAFNDGVLLHLDGPLDHARLRQALQQVVERHPSLRSRFEADGESQRFVGQVTVDLPVMELLGGDSQQRFEQHRATLTSTPFDLTKAPLLRASLVRFAPERHVLILLAHHLVCDGWSFAVVINELGQCYTALATGKPAALPAAVPYHDYAAWQSARRDGPEGRATLDHWRAQFRQAPPDLDLPLDRPRRPARTFAGATERLIVDGARYKAMQQLCGRSGATVFAGMLTAFAGLLTRLTHQEDLVIGIPAAGQSLMGVDRLAGHCVHFLPLRLNVTADTPFVKLLRTVREVVLDAYEHPDITYGRLLEALTLPRDPARPPLLSALFNLDRAGFKDLGFLGLRSSVELNAKASVVFDIDFNLMETDQGLMLCCHYNRDLFDATTIQRWLGHFLTLADSATTDPQRVIGDLDLLTAHERRVMLDSWNASQRTYPRDYTVHRLLAQQVAETPEAIAVVAGEERLTYRSLDRLSARLATQLLTRCTGPNAPIAICLPRTAALPVAVLAVLKAGACYVPLDSRYPDTRIAQILEDARPALVITQSAEWAPFTKHRVPTLMLDPGWEQQLPEGSAPPSTGSPEDVAYVMFTSGSTGRPKGVQVPHRAVVNLLGSMRDRPGIGPRDTLLAITTLSFDIHVAELLLPLSVGARIVLAEREAASDATRLIALLESSRATVFQATPVTMRMLIEAGWKGDGRIRLWCGGESFPRDLANALLERAGELWNCYGPTETTVWSSIDRIERGDGAVLMGTPLANTRLHLLDQRRHPVPIGVPGELYIGGDGLAHGYLGMPEQTAERFITDPFVHDGHTRLYRTGDVGRYRPDGRIEFLGRTDHQVKVRGFRIELGDIENALGRHPSVRQRVVLAQRQASGESALAAYVAIERGSGVSVPELRKHLRGLLPDYMVPAALVILDELPLTPNGKIDRKALPLPNAPLVLGDAASDQRPTPSISLHFQLLQLWEEVLNTRGVRMDDDFFAIGGNSLLAFRMISGLERLLGRRLPVATLFANPTIEGLSKVIMDGGVGSERPLLEVQPGSSTSRPFFYLHGDYLGGGYYCVSLARRIGKEVPFYALVPRHIDPNGPLPTIEELAAEHIRHMRAVSPTGPYLLGGFCIGGVIAFEIARQLIAQGHSVGLLTLIDAETVYFGERWARRLTRACSLVTGMSPSRQLAMFARLNQRIERLRQLGPFGLIAQGLSRIGLSRGKTASQNANSLSSRLHTVNTASAAAHEQLTAYLWSVSGYHPARLDIPAHLLASDEQAAVSRDPTVGWGVLLKRVEVRRLTGNHLESITRNLPKVAEILRPLIEVSAVTTPARSEIAPNTKTVSPELSRS